MKIATWISPKNKDSYNMPSGASSFRRRRVDKVTPVFERFVTVRRDYRNSSCSASLNTVSDDGVGRESNHSSSESSSCGVINHRHCLDDVGSTSDDIVLEPDEGSSSDFAK